MVRNGGKISPLGNRPVNSKKMQIDGMRAMLPGALLNVKRHPAPSAELS